MDSPTSSLRSGGEPRHPRLTADELLRIVREGDNAERFAVASEENMPVEGLTALALHAEPGIRGSILANASVPTSVLELMLAAYPDMAPFVATHPNAPLPLMERESLAHHTSLSLIGYTRRKGASAAQREALLLRAAESHGGTLGEAWEQVLGD